MDGEAAATGLSDGVIGAAMGRAKAVACTAWDDRCYDFADTVEEARTSCTPKVRCRIGWIVRGLGRESWDVWLDVGTGEGRLRRRSP